MPLSVVLAVGADKPGIVAAATRALAEAGANLEDTSMTILHGHFTMAMVVAAPDGVDVGAALGPVARSLGLTVDVRAIPEGTPATPPGDRWSVAVYGGDRPGIVAAVAEALAESGANVVDLTTRVVGEADRPVYAMHLEVALPEGADGDAVASRLRDAAGALGVDASMHPADADLL